MRRLALFFLIFILVGWVFVPAAHAQFNPMPSAEEFGAIVDQKTNAGQMSKEVYTVNTQASYMNTGTCMLVGCSKNPTSAFYYGRSPLALMGGVVTAMYTTPPASIAYWLKDTGQSLSFIPKQAYAQGIGFSGFSALLPLWKVFRNVAYFLLAVVMIVIGFMVMFRKKIDPKTVVTVQNALPRIILTLLLITFSYAIVGLLIDVMYLIMYLAVGLFQSSGLLPDPPGVWKLWGLDTNLKFFTQGTLAANTIQATRDVSVLKILGIPASALTGIISGVSLGLIIAIAGSLTGTPLGTVGGIAAITMPILEFILSLAMLFLFIRLLIFFVGAYIQIVLALLFGPVQILMEAIPGTNSFGSWINNLIANIAVFPVGVIFFMLAAIFANFADTHKSLWAPNLSAISFNTTSLSTLISLGILFAIPSIGKALKEALKAKPMVSAGPSAIFSPLGGAVQTTMGTASQFYYGSAMVSQVGKWMNKGKGGGGGGHP